MRARRTRRVQALRRHPGPRPRRPRCAAGRGRGAARRERRGQVHAVQHHRRARSRSDTGQMTWQGQPYAPTSPGDAIDRGIGLIHQEMRLLPDLSVAENVFLGRLPSRGGRIDRAEMNRAGRGAAAPARAGHLARPGWCASLRVAAQQQVEIAKALTLDAQAADPRRADGGPRRRGDRSPLRADRRAAEGGRVLHLRQPPAGGDRAHLRPHRGDARRATGSPPHDDRAGARVRSSSRRWSGAASSASSPTRDAPADERGARGRGSHGNRGPSATSPSACARARSSASPASSAPAAPNSCGPSPAPTRSPPGTVSVDGRPLRLAGPGDAIAAGVVLVPEDRKAPGRRARPLDRRQRRLCNLDRVARQGWLGPAGSRAVAAEAIKLHAASRAGPASRCARCPAATSRRS